MSEKNYSHEKDLASLKKEILNSLEHTQKGKGKSKKSSILVTGVLSILTFVSLAQTVQSASILNKVDEVKSSGVSSAALPSSLGDLPDMVGGC
jgi:hypothetical protein